MSDTRLGEIIANHVIDVMREKDTPEGQAIAALRAGREALAVDLCATVCTIVMERMIKGNLLCVTLSDQQKLVLFI